MEPGRYQGGQAIRILVEDQVPWALVRRIGVHNESVRAIVEQFLTITGHKPPIQIKLDWYY